MNVRDRLGGYDPVAGSTILSARLPMTLVCAWCDRVLRAGSSRVSHGICRDCAKAVK